MVTALGLLALRALALVAACISVAFGRWVRQTPRALPGETAQAQPGAPRRAARKNAPLYGIALTPPRGFPAWFAPNACEQCQRHLARAWCDLCGSELCGRCLRPVGTPDLDNAVSLLCAPCRARYKQGETP